MSIVSTAIDNPPAFLTSEDEIKYNLSSDTVTWINTIANANLWNWHIANASDTVLAYCQKFATIDQLAANRWARARATELARDALMTVDGEPYNHQFRAQAEAALEQLKSVKDGEIDIPGMTENGEQIKGAGPAVVNFAIDMQIPGGQVRVDRSASGGSRAAGYTQRIDWRSGFGWR